MTDNEAPIKVGGRWWLPKAPDAAVGGRLTYRNCQPILELDGALPGVSPGSAPTEPVTVFGEAHSTTFTLQRALLTSFHADSALHIFTSTYLVERVIVGDHFDPNSTPFSRVALRTTYIDDWVNRRPFHFQPLKPRGVSIRYVPPDVEQVPLLGEDSGTLTLGFSGTWGPSRDTAQVTQRAELAVDLDSGLTIDALWEVFIVPLNALITIGTGEWNFISSVRLSAASGVSSSDLEIFGDAIKTMPAGLSAPLPQKMLIPFSVLTLKGVACWLRDSATLGIVTNLALDARHGTGLLESRLGEAAQAAEGLHRRSFSGTRRIPIDETKQIRSIMLKDVPERHQGAAKDALISLGEPTLGERLHELFKSLDGALDDLVPDSTVWVREVKRARNRLAHQLLEESPPDVDEESDGDRSSIVLYFLTQTTALCVFLVRLMQCGVNAETLRARLRASREYHSLIRYSWAIGIPSANVEEGP